MPTRYYISLPNPERARGSDAAFAFRGQGSQALASELQDALRTPSLFERWRDTQADPDAVDPAMGATDPSAMVTGQQHDLHIDLILITSLPSSVWKQRLRLLAGGGWTLNDVSAA